MKNEKIASMDELDKVAGGTIIESYHVGFMLQDAGYDVFDASGKSLDFTKFRKVLNGMGVDKVEDHGGLLNANSYGMGEKTLNNAELIKFLTEKKGCKDLGAEVYAKRWLESVVK